MAHVMQANFISWLLCDLSHVTLWLKYKELFQEAQTIEEIASSKKFVLHRNRHYLGNIPPKSTKFAESTKHSLRRNGKKRKKKALYVKLSILVQCTGPGQPEPDLASGPGSGRVARIFSGRAGPIRPGQFLRPSYPVPQILNCWQEKVFLLILQVK